MGEFPFNSSRKLMGDFAIEQGWLRLWIATERDGPLGNPREKIEASLGPSSNYKPWPGHLAQEPKLEVPTRWPPDISWFINHEITPHWNKATERYLGGPILYETYKAHFSGICSENMVRSNWFTSHPPAQRLFAAGVGWNTGVAREWCRRLCAERRWGTWRDWWGRRPMMTSRLFYSNKLDPWMAWDRHSKPYPNIERSSTIRNGVFLCRFSFFYPDI